jgi:hypothetical protein
MPTVERSIDIDRSPEEVCALLTATEAIPAFDSQIGHIEQTRARGRTVRTNLANQKEILEAGARLTTGLRRNTDGCATSPGCAGWPPW